MNAACEHFATALETLRDGRFDDVAAEEMAALEMHLNNCAACAGALADEAPRPEAAFVVGSDMPSAADWDGAWQRIDEATAAAPPAPVGRRPRYAFRMLSGISAAAAVVLLATLAWLSPPSVAAPLDLQLAGPGDVHIDSIEVFGDATSIVLTTEGDNPAPVIWVIEEDERNS